MLVCDIWQGLDRLSFCENAILLDIKNLQQGEPFLTRTTKEGHDLIDGTGLPSQLVCNFLDDFALAVAGSGGKDNVSAVFAEFREDEKALTIYVARNEGLDEPRLESLRQLLGMIMARVSRGLLVAACMANADE
jgi:hypothetical protein